MQVQVQRLVYPAKYNDRLIVDDVEPFVDHIDTFLDVEYVIACIGIIYCNLPSQLPLETCYLLDT